MKRVKITLAAGLLLAMVLTFNGCSNGDDDGGGNDFDFSSPILNEDGSKSTITGELKFSVSNKDSHEYVLIDAGNVVNGVVTLSLPLLGDEYLYDASEILEGCTYSATNAKALDAALYFSLYNGENQIGRLYIGYRGNQEGFRYSETIVHGYVNKSGTLTCDGSSIYNKGSANFTSGWNNAYIIEKETANGTDRRISISNNLTKKPKWILELY
jgi:hypothetical protein